MLDAVEHRGESSRLCVVSRNSEILHLDPGVRGRILDLTAAG